MQVQDTLNQRQSTHGDFTRNAEASQMLKKVVRTYATRPLNEVQQEALDNICQKMARIVTGNPHHADNWHDIAGYATLAEQRCDDERG